MFRGFRGQLPGARPQRCRKGRILDRRQMDADIVEGGIEPPIGQAPRDGRIAGFGGIARGGDPFREDKDPETGLRRR